MYIYIYIIYLYVFAKRRFSIINHPFWGTPIFGNIRIIIYLYVLGMHLLVNRTIQIMITLSSSTDRTAQPLMFGISYRKGYISRWTFTSTKILSEESLLHNSHVLNIQKPIKCRRLSISPNISISQVLLFQTFDNLPSILHP